MFFPVVDSQTKQWKNYTCIQPGAVRPPSSDRYSTQAPSIYLKDPGGCRDQDILTRDMQEPGVSSGSLFHSATPYTSTASGQ